MVHDAMNMILAVADVILLIMMVMIVMIVMVIKNGSGLFQT